MRTTDPTMIAFATHLLACEGITAFPLDVHMSVLDGSLGILPQRLMVADRDHFLASAVLRDKSDFSRVKLALLLAAATATHTASEDVELIAALEPVVAAPAGETAGAELRLLAQVLHVTAIERRKLREQLRESQVRLVAARRDEPREAETRALRAKVEDLEKKLNALKSIDRSVNRRVETPRK